MNEVLGKLEEAPTRANIILGNLMLAAVGIGTGGAIEERTVSELIQNPRDKDGYIVAVFGAGVVAAGAFFARRAERAHARSVKEREVFEIVAATYRDHP